MHNSIQHLATKNIFDFLHTQQNRLTSEEVTNFILDSNKCDLSNFLTQLYAFLQQANEQSINNIDILVVLLRLRPCVQETGEYMYKSSIVTNDAIDQKRKILIDLHHNFADIQKELQRPTIGEIITIERFIDILTHQTEIAKKQIKTAVKQYENVKQEAKNLLSTYLIVSQDKAIIKSFSSFDKAEQFILTRYQQSKNKSPAIILNFFIVEIQAEKKSQEFMRAKQAILANSINTTELGKDGQWPHRRINSIAWLKDSKPHRIYNPQGANSIFRSIVYSIKQLDDIIACLQRYDWVWKIIDVLASQAGLTQAKINTLKEIRALVIAAKESIEDKVTTLSNVLDEALDSKIRTNSPVTFKEILNKQRLAFIHEKTKGGKEMDEILDEARSTPSNKFK